MDRHASYGDSAIESRRNFSLSAREHKGSSMCRTTSILDTSAWTASASPSSRLRSVTTNADNTPRSLQ
jgi:hypothetical protein